MEAAITQLMEAATNAAGMGVQYAPFVVGCAVLLRVAKFPDLGLEGSFALGACVFASLSYYHSLPVWIALLGSGLVAGLAGTFTGVQHYWFRLNALIAGILTTLAAFTMCFVILGDKPTLPTYNGVPLGSNARLELWVCGLVTVASIAIVSFLMSTRHGLLLRFSGEQPGLLRGLGVDVRNKGLLLLGLGNLIVGVSGGLIAMRGGDAALQIGAGKLVIAITSIVLGESTVLLIDRIVPGRVKKLWRASRAGTLSVVFLSGTGSLNYLIAAVFGSFVYWAVFEVTSRLFGSDAYSRAAVAVITLTVLITSQIVQRAASRFGPWKFIGT